MSIILYDRTDCPFCWKARLAFSFGNAKLRRIPVALGQKHPDVQRLNPAGSVPVMVDGDLVLGESAIIAEYANEAYAGGVLLPANNKDRARARQLVAYSDAQVGKALRGLVFERRSKPEAEQNQTIITASEQAWRERLHWLESRVQGPYFMDSFSLAECALLPRFALAERFGAGVDEHHPALLAWWLANRDKALSAQ